jgi:predicted ArsR family transcriptional regulator
MGPEEQVHRALANPLRRRALTSLRSRGDALEVQQLAAQLGVHVNTMRVHLGVLEEAGLVASEPQRRAGPGRPRLAYRVTPRATEVESEGPGYRLLARMLAGHLHAAADDPAGLARTIGAAWGQHLVDRPAPFEEVSTDDGIARLMRMLDDLGFEPELDADDATRPRIELRRCPFLDVAKDHQDVVCSVHLGLMRGALDELGVRVSATALHPFVAPDLCRAELEVPA